MVRENAAVSWPGWEVVRRIGSGGFGTVYALRRDVLGDAEYAALKVITVPSNPDEVRELRREGYDDASITARFESCLHEIVREYKIMARMKGHRNIVQCEDIRYVRHDDGMGWDISIKMELLTPMLDLPKEHFSEREVVRLGIDLCRALERCQREQILHRDIKPQNIFLSREGDYKLGDFGIAKAAEKTARGTKAGTYKYMAPEIFNNKPYGPLADLYSLGMVLYWLLNQRRIPFLPPYPASVTGEAEDLAQVRRFRGDPLPEPSQGSRALKDIVLRACAFSPEQRFRDVSQMRCALEALAGMETRKAESDTVMEKSTILEREEKPQPVRKKNRLLPLVAALGIAAGGLMLWSAREPEPAPHVHSWQGASCDSPERCDACGEIRGVPLSHDWQGDACVRCGLHRELPADPVPPSQEAEILGAPIAAGTGYTLWITETGQVMAAGSNDFGRCEVTSWQNIVDVDAGWYHSVGLRADGTVVAAGDNAFGQCNVASWQDIVDVDVGLAHTVGVRADGTVVAVGSNDFGQCEVSAWENIVAVSAGFRYTIGLKADGTVVAAGENSDGECDVSHLRNVIAVYAGVDDTLALLADGTVAAVGGNDFGECEVSHWRDIVAVSAASTYTLGLKSDGSLVAAGSRLPEQFDPTVWHSMAAISAGQDHVALIRRDGTLAAQGSNFNGECDVTGKGAF